MSRLIDTLLLSYEIVKEAARWGNENAKTLYNRGHDFAWDNLSPRVHALNAEGSRFGPWTSEDQLKGNSKYLGQRIHRDPLPEGIVSSWQSEYRKLN